MHDQNRDALQAFISAETWERRKAFVGFGPVDEEILRELHPLALEYNYEAIEHLHDRLVQFPELRPVLPTNTGLTRLKILQRQYFNRLTGGDYDTVYAASRLRVGAVYQRIGLIPDWFLGTYSIYLELVLPKVLRAFEYDRDKQARAVTALTKLLTLDQGLTLLPYVSNATAGSASA